MLSHRFSGPLKIYVASNDYPGAVSEQFVTLPKMFHEADTYVCTAVLAGLNGLLHVKPKKIIFGDTNPYAVEYMKMVTESASACTYFLSKHVQKTC